MKNEDDIFSAIVAGVEPEKATEPVLRHLYALSVKECIAWEHARSAALKGNFNPLFEFSLSVLPVDDASRELLLAMTPKEFNECLGKHFAEDAKVLNQNGWK